MIVTPASRRPQPPHAGGELSAIAQRLPSNDKLREMALLSKEIDELDAAANARILIITADIVITASNILTTTAPTPPC